MFAIRQKESAKVKGQITVIYVSSARVRDDFAPAGIIPFYGELRKAIRPGNLGLVWRTFSSLIAILAKRMEDPIS